MSKQQHIEVGATVEFVGFSGEDLPDNAELLNEGSVYEIAEIREEDGAETAYLLQVDNPNFDESKRKTKKNQPHIMIDVFSEEIRLADAVDAEEEVADETHAAAGELESAIDYDAIKKGDDITAFDAEDVAIYGTVTRKAKGNVYITDENGDKHTLDGETYTFYEGKIEAEADLGEEPEEEDAELKKMLKLEEGEEDQEILDLVAATDDLCGLAQEMSEESASTDYKLGGVLYHVRITGAYKELDEEYAGNKGFEKYVEKELSVGYRKARYLMDIFVKWNKFGLPIEKVQEIGWTKAQEIARVMDKDNAEDLLAIAEDRDNTVADIKETIKETYTSGSKQREPVRKITFKFRLTEEAGANVREFFEQAKEHFGKEYTDEMVFEAIVTDWATENLNVRKVGRSKAKGGVTAAPTSKSQEKRVAKQKQAA